MYRFLLLVSLLFLPGCYLTQAGALKELSPEFTARYKSVNDSQKEIIKELAKLLKDTERGGVKVEVDDDGRVKSFTYTPELDLDGLYEIAKIKAYEAPQVTSVLDEAGNFVMKATNFAVPFASIYYGHKNHVETQRANVAITNSNNSADQMMWSAYTSNYLNNTNTSVTDTSVTDTSITDTSVTEINDTNVTDTSITDRDYERISETINE